MRYTTILEFARSMRQNPTPAEEFFWDRVKNRAFHGFKFYCQYIIEHSSFNGDKNFYISDFYCHHNKLVIELDGDIHLEQIEFDQLRENDLYEMGFTVIRFKNDSVLYKWNQVEIDLLKYLHYVL